jgi:hypothetical protein
VRYVDQTLMEAGAFGYLDNESGWVVPLFITDDEIAALLAEYDPDNQYSPSADTSRKLARSILDALKAKAGT